MDGAHDQTWDGFNFANGQATSTGVIMFGGYAGLAAPHHITLRNIKLLASLTGHNDQNDHGDLFLLDAVGGPHDILIEDCTVDGTGPAPLSSALHFYHSDSANPNAWNATIRNLVVTGTYQAVILWDSTLRNITIDGAAITARYNAVRYRGRGRNVRATTSQHRVGQRGFSSSLGTNPPGVTFVNTYASLTRRQGRRSRPTRPRRKPEVGRYRMGIVPRACRRSRMSRAAAAATVDGLSPLCNTLRRAYCGSGCRVRVEVDADVERTDGDDRTGLATAVQRSGSWSGCASGHVFRSPP